MSKEGIVRLKIQIRDGRLVLSHAGCLEAHSRGSAPTSESEREEPKRRNFAYS